MKEAVYEITENYYESLTILCKNHHDSAFRFYMDFINRLNGVFDLLANIDSISEEEHINMYIECTDKLHEVYNKYGK